MKVGLNDENWKERAGEFLEDVTWEPVDGQHILHACQEIAFMEVGRAGGISEEVFASRFVRRLAYTVVYDDPAFYVHESRRLNAHHFARRKFATVGETMRKMRELWEHYGKPIGTNEDGLRRVAFLACLPSILSTTTLAKQGEVSVKDIAVAFQDWLPHVQQERVEDFEAMLAVCIDYDTGRTQYSAADELRWQEYHRKLASAPNTKKPARKDMAISWLRPLKGLAPVDYRRLCIKASTPGVEVGNGCSSQDTPGAEGKQRHPFESTHLG